MFKIIAMKTRIKLSSGDQTIFFHKRSKQSVISRRDGRVSKECN